MIRLVSGGAAILLKTRQRDDGETVRECVGQFSFQGRGGEGGIHSFTEEQLTNTRTVAVLFGLCVPGYYSFLVLFSWASSSL